MYLKALEMRGFKSFPDKTVLDFEKGITAIVGPNGSGKSNISDAVRWVLGEMSPKSLRGQKMEDVIFSGTAKRPQTGFCEVSLVIDNADGALPDAHETVKITRKYYRNGESEYKINEKNARLRDIYELFLNTGIGREGYSVIGQGKISEVISQKGDERRHIFEEAAGISKYRYRKNDAEKKLAETEANLVRLRDIVSEIEGRLGPLEKAAENAKKYLVLAARKKELEVASWVARIGSAAADADVFARRTDDARKGYDEYNAALEKNEAETAALSDEKQRKTVETEEARSAIAALEQEKNDLASRRALSENDISHYKARMEEIAAAQSALEAGELATLKEACLARENDCEQALLRQRQAQEEDAACEKAEKEASLAREAAEKEEARAEAEKNAAQEALTACRIELSAAENDEKSAQARREYIEDERARAVEDAARESGCLDAAKRRIEDAAKEKASLEKDLADEEKNTEKARAAHAACDTRVRELERTRAGYLSQKEAFERMDRLLEGFPGSVRAVMEHTSELPGICGPVSKLLSADGAYVTAVETALGAAVANIVVEDEDAAKRAIRFLKERGAGRATFLPLTSIRANVIREPSLAHEKGFIGIGSTLVRCAEKYRRAADYLLGRTIVADDIDNASALARKFDFRYRLCTLDGQLINAGGSYTGGSAAAKAGAISRSADLAALEKKLEDLEKALNEARTGLREAADALSESESFSAAIRNDLRNCADALAEAQRDEMHYREQLAAAQARAKLAEEKLADFGTADAEKRKALAVRKTSVELRLSNAADALLRAAENVRAAQENEDEKKARRAEGRFELLSAEKDLAAAKTAVTAAAAQSAAAQARYAALEDERAGLCEKLNDIRDALVHGVEKTAAIEHALAEGKKRFDLCRGALDAAERRLSDLRGAQSGLIHERDRYFRELTRCETALEERKKIYDELTSKLWEEYELTYTEAASLGYPAPDEAALGELASVRAKIRALGSVNVDAVDEYRETKTRYGFLTGQISDLEDAGKGLENVIKRLEADMKRCFSKAIAEINTQFGAVFAELFGGGTASVVVSDEENLLDCGIEINVQPPGKMVKNLSLLSGGEQAFTAIALYFAILNVNPAPFYIFDEIEAALDDVNVIRFGEYLRRHSGETQFIVITHRRGSMEAADRLYGVTMQEKGVSGFLKLDVGDVEKKLGVKL